MPNLLVTEDAHCRLELARVNASNDCGHCSKYFTASHLVLRRPLLDMRTEQGLNEPAHLAELSNSRAQCADSVYDPAARQWMPPTPHTVTGTRSSGHPHGDHRLSWSRTCMNYILPPNPSFSNANIAITAR